MTYHFSVCFPTKTMVIIKSISCIRWENTAPGTEFAHHFCSGSVRSALCLFSFVSQLTSGTRCDGCTYISLYIWVSCVWLVDWPGHETWYEGLWVDYLLPVFDSQRMQLKVKFYRKWILLMHNPTIGSHPLDCHVVISYYCLCVSSVSLWQQ